MIKVTFEFDNTDAAMDFLADCMPQGAKVETAAPAGDKPRRGRPPKVAAHVDPTPAAPATPAVATPAAPATPTKTDPVSAAVSVPFAALVDPLTKLADIDLDKAMGILAKYGVKKASELKADQFGTVLAEVNAALAVPTKQSLI